MFDTALLLRQAALWIQRPPARRRSGNGSGRRRTGNAMPEAGQTAASGPSSLAERTRQAMACFTPSEKRAAHALLSHYPFAGLGTVAEFAARAGISAPSVLRFVTRLGFGGFPEFQKHLREELEAQLKSPLMKADPVGFGAAGSSEFA